MGDARSIVVAGLVGILVAMLIVKFYPISCCASTVEGFADTQGVTTCPEDTKTYTDKLGNINCCDGEVDGNECNGKIDCTFSPTLPNVPICGAYSRKRKWFGTVYPGVLQFYTENPDRFAELISFLKMIIPYLISLSATNKAIKPQMLDATKAILAEEIDWYSSIKSDYAEKKLKKKQYIRFLAEEDMYVWNRLNEIFKNTPEIYATVEKKRKQAEVCDANVASSFTPRYFGRIPVTVQNYFASNKNYFTETYMKQFDDLRRSMQGNPTVSVQESEKVNQLYTTVVSDYRTLFDLFEKQVFTQQEFLQKAQQEMMFADQQLLNIFKFNPVALPLLAIISLQNKP
jgi:hypothetical protein